MRIFFTNQMARKIRFWLLSCSILLIAMIDLSSAANDKCNEMGEELFKDKNKITLEINRTCSRLFEFHNLVDKKIKPWDLLKVSFEVSNQAEYAPIVFANPVSITVNAKGSSLSFSLPMGYMENSVIRREVYLCPNSTTAPLPGRNQLRKLKKTHRPKRETNDGTNADDTQRILVGDNGTHHHVGPRNAEEESTALVSLWTTAPTSVQMSFSMMAIQYSNFIVTVDDSTWANISASSSDVWTRMVTFPSDASMLRINALSENDMCATLAIQAWGDCPFISSEGELYRAVRRLTFTRQGTMIVRRDELADDRFFIVMVPFTNDKPCGNMEYVPGRFVKKKWATLQVTRVNSISDHLTPILLTVGLYALFFGAVIPIKVVKSLRSGRKKEIDNAANPLPITGHYDDDASLVNASASRCISPPPVDVQEHVHVEPEVGNLISIGSSNTSIVNGEIDGPSAQVPHIAALDPIPELFGDDAPSTSPKGPEANLSMAPAQAAEEEVQIIQETEGLRHRISPATRSDISCILKGGVLLQPLHKNEASSTKWYGWIQLIVNGFLLLVEIQRVSWFSSEFMDGGNLDGCYYNGRCGIPLGSLNSFNHTFSNIGYVMLGGLALIILKRRYSEHQLELRTNGGIHPTGLPTHFGMMTALGCGMMFQGLFSAIYHQCPNSASIQFESINIYLIAMLALFKVYGARHEPTQPHVAYGVALAFWTLVTVSTLGSHPAWWWVPFCVMQMILMPIMSLQIYYHGHVRFSTVSIKSAYNSYKDVVWADVQRGDYRPLFKNRLVALSVVNVANIVGSIIVAKTGIATLSEHILSSVIVNFVLYCAYYLGNKIAAKEPVSKLTWFYLVATVGVWAISLRYFYTGTMDWKLSPAQSRALNRECQFFGFYDSHDAWHLLSAVALFFSLMSLLTLDDELKAKRRTDIAIF